MSTPKYQVDDIVYLRESATLGFLEAFKISEVKTIRRDGTWAYGIIFSHEPPLGVATFIDNFNRKKTVSEVYYTEDELIIFCEALLIMRRKQELDLIRTNSLISAHACDPATT